MTRIDTGRGITPPTTPTTPAPVTTPTPAASTTPVAPAALTTAAPAGLTDSSSVDRGGTTVLPADATLLADASSLSPETLGRLGTLTTRSGVINGPIGAYADVDFPVPAFSAPNLAASSSAFLSLDLPSLSDLIPSFSLPAFTHHIEISEIIHTETPLFGLDHTTAARTFAPVTSEVTSNFQSGATSSDNYFASLKMSFDGKNFVGKEGINIDINALVQWVLRESYLETCKDLADYANKVKYYNEVKKQIREELKVQREAMAGMAGADDDAAMSPPLVKKSFDTEYSGQTPGNPTANMSPEQIAEYQAQQQLQIDIANELPAYQSAVANADKLEVQLPTSGLHDFTDGTFGSYSSSASRSAVEQNAAQQMIDWYKSLSPEEQEAVRTMLEQDGLEGGARGTDRDSPSEDETWRSGQVNMPALEEGQDIEAYFRECAATMAGQIPGEIGGSGTQEYAVSLRLPSTTAEVTDPNAVSLDGYPALQQAGYDPATGNFSNNPGAPQNEGACGTKAEAEAYGKELEDMLNSVGDDAQLANVDLQNVLQKQQQTLQMMSNISKQLHDTALAIIRKIGG